MGDYDDSRKRIGQSVFGYGSNRNLVFHCQKGGWKTIAILLRRLRYDVSGLHNYRSGGILLAKYP
jgi:hypothetical protein